jgi:hypothetical protein
MIAGISHVKFKLTDDFGEQSRHARRAMEPSGHKKKQGSRGEPCIVFCSVLRVAWISYPSSQGASRELGAFVPSLDAAFYPSHGEPDPSGILSRLRGGFPSDDLFGHVVFVLLAAHRQQRN